MSGAWSKSTGPRNGMSERSGIGSDVERHDVGRRARLAEDQAVEEEGEAGCEQRRADAGDVLADAEDDREEGHEQPGDRSGQKRREHAEPEAAAEK